MSASELVFEIAHDLKMKKEDFQKYVDILD